MNAIEYDFDAEPAAPSLEDDLRDTRMRIRIARQNMEHRVRQAEAQERLVSLVRIIALIIVAAVTAAYFTL